MSMEKDNITSKMNEEKMESADFIGIIIGLYFGFVYALIQQTVFEQGITGIELLTNYTYVKEILVLGLGWTIYFIVVFILKMVGAVIVLLILIAIIYALYYLINWFRRKLW